MQRFTSSVTKQTVRTYATRWPRPKPGTAERPPYRPSDPLNAENPHVTVTKLTEDGLTFVHRPPPSAPSPNSLTTNPVSPLLRPASAATPSEGTPLPPFLRPSANKEQPQRMSDEDIKEMKRLRFEDPKKWTRGVLAKKFGCTQTFVGLKAALRKPDRREAIEARDAEHTRKKEKWSDRHQEVMAIRKRRKELW